MTLSQGEILHERYRIVKLLSHGGFGAIYRAWDTQQNTPCAIKENLDASPAAQKQFNREASMQFNLNHPSLPHVFDAFSLPGRGQYLAMDFVEGEDLNEKLEQAGGPLPEAQVMAWIEQICDALTYLHNQTPPIIHRDIKPANIRITPQGRAMIVDFGIAKVYDSKLRTTLGARAVTPGFSPPEQYGIQLTEPRSDVYALGATIYALLTGKEPPPSVELLMGNAALLPPIHEVNPQVSPHISQAVKRAMALDPDDRFGSVAQFKTALFHPLDEVQVGGALTAQGRAALAAAGRRRALPGWVWLAGAALLIVLAVGIGLFLSSRGGGPARGESTYTPTVRVAKVAPSVTPVSPSPTLAPTATSTPAPTLAPSDTPTELPPTPVPPTATPDLATAPVLLKDWILTEFQAQTSGCFLADTPCWSGSQSRQAGDDTPFLLKLTSPDFIVLREEWKNPALVFWHRYITRTDSFAVVSILIGGSEIFLKQYTGSNGAGCYDAISLSAYLGRPIKGYFYAKARTVSLTKPYSVDWTIQDVRILPDFSPDILPGVVWCKGAFTGAP
jgi:hypothetical protein